MALLNYNAKGSHHSFLSFLGRTSCSERRNWIKASVLGIVILIILVLLSSVLADRMFGPKEVNNPILNDVLSCNTTSRTACFFLYCFISPLLEESIYRGFLLQSIASRTKWWQAVVITSCVFSAAHFSGENSVQLFLVGCVLGSAYSWTGDLAAPITIHSVYNATILFVTMMSKT